MTFDEWMVEFDKAVEKHFGVDTSCLPDWYFWNAWKAVDEAVEDFIDYIHNY